MPKGMVAILSEKQISTCNLRWGEIMAVGVAIGNPGKMSLYGSANFIYKRENSFAESYAKLTSFLRLCF